MSSFLKGRHNIKEGHDHSRKGSENPADPKIQEQNPGAFHCMKHSFAPRRPLGTWLLFANMVYQMMVPTTSHAVESESSSWVSIWGRKLHNDGRKAEQHGSRSMYPTSSPGAVVNIDEQILAVQHAERDRPTGKHAAVLLATVARVLAAKIRQQELSLDSFM